MVSIWRSVKIYSMFMFTRNISKFFKSSLSVLLLTFNLTMAWRSHGKTHTEMVRHLRSTYEKNFKFTNKKKIRLRLCFLHNKGRCVFRS